MILKLTIEQQGKNNQVHEFSSMEELYTFADQKRGGNEETPTPEVPAEGEEVVEKKEEEVESSEEVKEESVLEETSEESAESSEEETK